jgi:hypothetical protein
MYPKNVILSVGLFLRLMDRSRDNEFSCEKKRESSQEDRRVDKNMDAKERSPRLIISWRDGVSSAFELKTSSLL